MIRSRVRAVQNVNRAKSEPSVTTHGVDTARHACPYVEDLCAQSAVRGVFADSVQYDLVRSM